MLSIPGYEIKEKINSRPTIEIYRAVEIKSERPVILKYVPTTNEFDSSVVNLKNEYEVLKHLENSKDMLKVYSFEKHIDGFLLSAEDIFGYSIKHFNKKKMLELNSFFIIALKICDLLSELHKNKVIHKDIKPDNIIINPINMEIRIIDFGISTRLSKEETKWTAHKVLEGSLQYISPEQTGRMNRVVDYRSDFYSLGITFYEMLTGSLPFSSKDHLELVYSHINRIPLMVHQLNPEVPLALSKIVEKLMSKTAEKRYQTALGLKYDLEICYEYFQKEKENYNRKFDFELGKNDISDEFKFPQKLYGRDEDIAVLLDKFSEVCKSGKTDLILIGGYSGVGKSSLVKEINKPITGSRGFFLSGKYEQYNRNVPFSAIIHIFKYLLEHILSEMPDEIEKWKNNILLNLGHNGKVITDVIPELECIIGAQPPVSELGSNENANRFYHVFKDFIKVFASSNHPLVIFLDDAQWIDGDSLILIKYLLEDESVKYIYLILAYRDNEVDAAHPFLSMLNSLKQKGYKINSINLKPLHLKSVISLLSDSFHEKEFECEELANAIYRKTGGNPYFIYELLKQLIKTEMIKFNYDERKWDWEIDKINSVTISDNIIELLISRIKKLPDDSWEVLKIASCIGNNFNLNLLSRVISKAPRLVSLELMQIISEELIVPIGDNYKLAHSMLEGEDNEQKNYLISKNIHYNFQHDRVQQASYELLSETSKKHIRLKIGKILLKDSSEVELDEKLFDIVNHLNVGYELLESDFEIKSLIQLNYQAGRKAKFSTAYKPALYHISFAMKLLKKDSWENEYELTFSIYLEKAELEYLNGNFEKSEECAKSLIEHAKTGIEKATVYKLLIIQYSLSAKYAEAIDALRKSLTPLGIDLPENNFLEVLSSEFKLAKSNLGTREISSLINDPEISLPEKKIAVKLLTAALPASYLSNPNLWSVIVLKTVNLCLTYGNIADTYGYSCYGILLGGISGDYKNGYEFSLLALKLSEKYNSQSDKCKASNVLANLVQSWVRHIKETEDINRIGFQAGLDSGEVQHGGYCALHTPINSFYRGRNTGYILEESNKFFQFCSKVQNFFAMDTIKGIELILLNIMNSTENELEFKNAKVNEPDFLETCANHQSYFAICVYRIMKAQILYLYDKSNLALSEIIEAEKLLNYIAGEISIAEHNFYYSLILLSLYKESDKFKRLEYINKIKSNQKKMKTWAENCPENFYHKYLLIEAEIARLEYKNWKAIKLYDESIAEARKNEFLQNEALALELAGKFWLKKNNRKLAQNYLSEAFLKYENWGANRKIQLMKKEYSNLLLNNPIDIEYSSSLRLSTTVTEIFSVQSFEFQSIIKNLLEISAELNLGNLLIKIIQIMTEGVNADRGVILLKNNGNLFIQADSTDEFKNIKVLSNIIISEYTNIPKSIIYYVDRTNEYRIVGNAVQDEKYGKDPYIEKLKIKSILCSPIILNGELTGILYLENKTYDGAFNADDLLNIKILISQIGISIDNALKYSKIEQKVSEKSKEIELNSNKILEKNKFLEESNEYLRLFRDRLISHKLKFKDFISDYFIVFYPEEINLNDLFWPISINGYEFIVSISHKNKDILKTFIPMFSVSIINQFIIDRKIYDPIIILEYYNKFMLLTLDDDKKEKYEIYKMDICIFRFSKTEIVISGTHDPIFCFQNDNLSILNFDKKTLKEEKEFVMSPNIHEIQHNKPGRTELYIFNNGFFEEENLEKITLTRVKVIEILKKYHSAKSNIQKEKIKNEIIGNMKDMSLSVNIEIVGIII